MIVDLRREIRSLIHKNNCEETKLLVSSVPRSSMIRRSQSRIKSSPGSVSDFLEKSCLSQTVKQIKYRKIQNTVCGFEKLAGNTVREKGLAYSGAAVQKQVLCALVKIIYKFRAVS